MTDYYVPWDVAEARALDEAQSYASPTYDLSRPEERARCWLAHLAESYAGGFGLFCDTYGFDRENMDAVLYRGAEPNERNKRQLTYHKPEWDSLSSNDPFWAQLNIAGAKHGK